MVFTEENSRDDYIPVHIILGIEDYNRIRLQEAPVIGRKPSYPVAEQTKLGWILFGGKANQLSKELCHFTMTGQQQFEQLCNIDVLGLKDSTTESKFDHDAFKKQIVQNENGQYTTRLPWKPDQVQLPNNKALSFGRLQSTTKKLERMGKLDDYHAIMQEQHDMGMLESPPNGSDNTKVHYIPHHPVIKEESKTTPLRIVYDCSAKSSNTAPSLNECLETGPPLQPHLFDVLLRNRFRKFLITGDIKKAFHQIHLQAEYRDVQQVLSTKTCKIDRWWSIDSQE